MQSIARKHRVEPAELPELRMRIAGELDELAHAEERGRELEQEARDAENRYRELAGELSGLRRIAAGTFASAVSEAMAGLGMPGGKFEIAVEQLTEGFDANGIEKGVLVGDAATRIKQTLMFDLPIVTKAETQALMQADIAGGGKRTAR